MSAAHSPLDVLCKHLVTPNKTISVVLIDGNKPLLIETVTVDAAQYAMNPVIVIVTTNISLAPLIESFPPLPGRLCADAAV